MCEACHDFVEAHDDVELAVERQHHLDTDHGRNVPQEELEEAARAGQGTVLDVKYLAWGMTALLALFSARWPALGVLLPFAALLAYALTNR
jgi:hypothetical protein